VTLNMQLMLPILRQTVQCPIINRTLTSLPEDTSSSSAGPEAMSRQGLSGPEPSENVTALPNEWGDVGSTSIFTAHIYKRALLCLKVPSFRPLVLLTGVSLI